MQPSYWQPPVELSEQEEQIVKKIRTAKLLVFLRKHRHELLDETFQQELAKLYRLDYAAVQAAFSSKWSNGEARGPGQLPQTSETHRVRESQL